MNKKIITSIPIEFDKQDEGHDYHGPSTWKVITTYYNNKGVYPYKKYNNKKVLTGAFKNEQLCEKELADINLKNIKQYASSVKNLKK
jgi:hypothetical protein